MKQFFGYRVLGDKEIKVEYYILNSKNSYGIQIAKRDSSLSSIAVLNVSDNESEAVYFASKCFQNITLPENLPKEIEKLLKLKNMERGEYPKERYVI